MHRVTQSKPTAVRRLMIAIALSVVIMAIGGCTLPAKMSSSSGGGSSGGGSSGGGSSGGGSSGGGSSDGGSSDGGSSDGGSSDGGSSDNGASIDDLDAELESSLDDFDSRVGSGTGSSDIDVLDPMGGGGTTRDTSQAVYEELESGGESVAERAEQGSPSTPDGVDGEASGSGGGNAGSGGGNGGGNPGDSPTAPLPEDIDDGRGDNIVEQQIREAAMRETDPLLREKLWEEYRRIKGQGG